MPTLNKCHEVSTLPSREMRTLKVMIATSTTATKTSLNNKYEKWWLFCSYWFLLAASFLLDRARCKWTGRSTVEVNLEKDLNLEISRCHSADYRIVLKCVPRVQHVRHDYFSSLNQSDHYFLASLLPLQSRSALGSLPVSNSEVSCSKSHKKQPQS